MKIIDGGVTAATGFEAGSTAAGIKYEGREDMAIVFSQVPCKVAGTFTTNVVKAAPVLWDKNIVDTAPYVRAVIVNSGIANACTGEEGMRICAATAQAVCDLTGEDVSTVLVGSTGVIGRQIEEDKIVAGVKALMAVKEDTIEAGTKAAKAIMTTDTHKKEIALTFEVGGKTITLGGMCKGSGMIHPNMCTMLGYITTDLNISKALLQEALSEVVKDTFNMISVDGDTSTNDTLLLLANGMADNEEITEKNADYTTFKEVLYIVCEYLAKEMAGDGEGATALFTCRVVGAKNTRDAKVLAKAVICSSLTKAAIFGHDANWGRILCALGYSGAQFDPAKVEMHFESAAGSILIFKDGVAADYSEEEATKILSEKEVTVICNMHEGDAAATAWGCDLSYDYVKINADYRS
ncbi:MAG: bifunctional glutamate N-acetyltransferase/amino-acid acetyltransferase ArgJ [Lachnospiraceae bacterium]|nr:bifunctional glutamate N-acetyltransferase/amino-acid acetyltransferase ArgJ [Lachnospiraceae bacterium]